MKVRIMDDEETWKWSCDQWMGVSILISILDVKSKTPTFYHNPRIIDKMELRFNHIAHGEHAESLLSEKQCHEIEDFILSYADDVENVVIHCEADLSRAYAIGFAICRLLSLDDEWIWDEGHPKPNEHCIYKLNRFLRLGLEEGEIRSLFNEE